jgi:hypothetical protein
VVLSKSKFLVPIFVPPTILGLVHAVSRSKMAAVGILAFAKIAFESALMSKICMPLALSTDTRVEWRVHDECDEKIGGIHFRWYH